MNLLHTAMQSFNHVKVHISKFSSGLRIDLLCYHDIGNTLTTYICTSELFH